MEIEDTNQESQLSKEKVNEYVRQKLKEFTANQLLRFEKRIRERYAQNGKEFSKELSDGTIRVFREFERVCDKYIEMFELYCERNILVPRIPDTHVTPKEAFSDEEKELDRKLEKRKRELLENRRRKNILMIQKKLIESDYGKALARLGEIANTEPIEQLEADLESLRNTQDILQQTQLLTQQLKQDITGVNDEWNVLESEEMNNEFMEGLMKVFDNAGLE